MRRLVLAVLALVLARADMYPDASNAKLPEAQQNLGISASLESFGAACDGTTDDAAAFTAATAWIAAGNGRVVRVPARVCATSQAVQLGNGRERSTTLASPASAGASSVAVASALGIQSGDGIVVQLTGGQYRGTVSGPPAGASVPVTPNLTGAAAAALPVWTGSISTYHGGGFVGAGSCFSVIGSGTALSTIKYIGPAAPATTLSAPAITGATSLSVTSIGGFTGNGLGVPIGITLDSGAVWWSWVSETPAGTTVQMIDELPGPAAAGNAVVIANNPVLRVSGPMLGPVVEGMCLDANGLASVGMDARHVNSGKFRGIRGLTASNYTGVGFWLHTNRSNVAASGGYTDTDHELYTDVPGSQDSIGVWMSGAADTQVNAETRLGFSRNRFYGGQVKMGGASPYAAAYRLQHADNNTYEKIFSSTSGAGLGAGLWRQPSWQRQYFPQENYFISPALVGGVVNGATIVTSNIGTDYMTGYATSDGQPVPKYGIAGTDNLGSNFGILRPVLQSTTQFSLGSNLLRSINVIGRYAFVVEGVNAGNTVLDVVDLANPEAPALISQTAIGAGNPIGRAALGGGYLYIPVGDNANSIYVVDISNLQAPVLVSTIALANSGAGAVALSGSLLVAGTRTGGVVRTYDVSNPTSPRQLATMSLSGVTRTTSITLRGRYAYLSQFGAAGKGLEVVDLVNPAAPASVGSYDAGADVYGMAVAGRHAYLAKSNNILDVVNIANPGSMTSVGTLAMKNVSVNFAGPLPIIGNHLFWPGSTAANSVQMVDISDPAMPVYLDQILNQNSAAIDFGFVGTSLVTVQSGTAANFRLHRIYGTTLPAVMAGALTTDQLRVRDGGGAIFDSEITANRGITAGLHGVASKGPLSGNALSLTAGAGGARLAVVCGTTPGTAKLVAYAGTSTTPVTVLDNIGAGVGGC